VDEDPATDSQPAEESAPEAEEEGPAPDSQPAEESAPEANDEE
jgi:hypothetical protein